LENSQGLRTKINLAKSSIYSPDRPNMLNTPANTSLGTLKLDKSKILANHESYPFTDFISN